MPLVYFISGLEYKATDNETIYLINALKTRGITSSVESWDDPKTDWNKPDLCIHRNSPYLLEPTKFLEWAKKLEKTNPVWNSYKVTAWNLHKGYLIDLQNAGVPVPPTIMIKQNSDQPLQYYIEDVDWEEIILKPTITGGSLGLRRFKKGSLDAEEHFRKINKTGFTQSIPNIREFNLSPTDTLVQEYQPEIVTAGEVSIIYFGGEYSHAVFKKVKSGDFRAHPVWGASVEPYKASRGEIDVADRALEVVGDFIHFARVDLLNTIYGPVIIELELIEPWLFFDHFPETVNSYADHIASFFN